MWKIRASDGVVLTTYPVGLGPLGVAYDGVNIWVANSYDNTVSKLRPSDGVSLSVLATQSAPVFMAFDGANMWVSNYFRSTVSKM